MKWSGHQNAYLRRVLTFFHFQLQGNGLNWFENLHKKCSKAEMLKLESLLEKKIMEWKDSKDGQEEGWKDSLNEIRLVLQLIRSTRS